MPQCARTKERIDMTEKYIIAIDQSTTGTKALLIARDGTIRDKRYMEHRQIHPRAGWVEHDPEELLANVRALIRELMSENALGGERIQAVAVTNQRETTLALSLIHILFRPYMTATTAS